RKLLPTRAKEPQSRRRDKREFTRRSLWRVGSSVDLKRAHNPLYWASSRPRDPAKSRGYNVHWVFSPTGAGSHHLREALVDAAIPAGYRRPASTLAEVHWRLSNEVSHAGAAPPRQVEWATRGSLVNPERWF